MTPTEESAGIGISRYRDPTGGFRVGGRVEGDRRVCPWYGWHWNGDGSHALIPYSERKRKSQLRIRPWACRGCPRPRASASTHTISTPPTLKRVKGHVQMIVENAADPYPIPTVHHGARPETPSFEVREHRLHAAIRTTYGAGRRSTWLTPQGAPLSTRRRSRSRDPGRYTRPPAIRS